MGYLVMAIIYEEQDCDTSWYSKPLKGGTAKDNYERIVALRKLFCHSLTINKDGSLNKKYFCTQTHETAMDWNDIELLQLYEGILKYGVDSVEKWIRIKSEFLPQRDFIEIRLKLSQLLGTQDLAKYKDHTFKSEKEINEQFAKNKEEGIKEGIWSEESQISLKREVAKMTKTELKKVQQKEFGEWKRAIYENPVYIYRTETVRTSNVSKDGQPENDDANSSKPPQQNTIDQMFKKAKQDEPENKKVEQDQNRNHNKNYKEDQEEVEEIKTVEQPKKIQPAKKKSKRTKKTPKNVVLLPEDSDDEEMLCVE